MTTKNPSNGRGCGSRKPESSYLCTDISIHGDRTVEDFIIDPPKVWPQEWQRGYTLLKDKEGHYNVGIFVGKEHYQTPWDFIEETRRFGVSRRIPNNFPFDKLIPGKSKMIFFHARAYPDFRYKVDKTYPDQHCKATEPKQEPCAYDLRHLSFLHHLDAQIMEEDPDIFHVVGNSYDYYGVKPYEVPDKTPFKIAAFMATPITHVEYYQKADEQASQNANKAGFDTYTLNW